MTDWDRLASGDGLGRVDRAMTQLLGIAESGDAPAFFRALKQHTETLRELLAQDPGEYAAWRASIKAACSKINLKTLDALVNPPTVGGSDSITSTLPRLAAERCELWHDKDGNAYGTITRDDHREHWRLDSAGFRDWLAFLAYSQSGRSASSENLKAATNALAGQAKFDGPEFIPCWRVGHRDGSYWLDLGDDRWRAVEITATGWAIRDNPPVRFLRTKATRPLPEPVSGGDVAELWELVNVPEQERLLVLAWILECYRADTPYSLLELTGEQGSAKSTAQRILRRFIDPNAVELRGRPKTVEDVFVAAANSHLISYENLSSLTNDQSDALCTICTGGGYASRRFFTNGEEHLLEAHNPVALNGISPVVIRPDLLDRSISVALPVITHRRTEREVQEALNRAAPRIMGALLDLLCETLTLLPTVQIPPESLPRMADFARLGEAMARVLKYPQGHFLRLYTEHRRTSITRTIE
ncbi:hypothetical protein BAE29_02155, partial [Acidithiobacillus caldus]|uniref:hypothetical protein n=4 Tax=Acidithiobacillus caldus TaxID=33059 RepID=UPI0008729067